MDMDFRWGTRTLDEMNNMQGNGGVAPQATPQQVQPVPADDGPLSQEEFLEMLELQDKYGMYLSDKKMGVGLDMALAGHPEALMSMLTRDASSESAAQKEMDALEKTMQNDLWGLLRASSDEVSRILQTLPIYQNMFEELVAKGAKSRLGTGWDDWQNIFDAQQGVKQGRSDKAKVAEDAAIAEFRGKFTEGSFGKDQSITRTASNGKTVTITLTPNGVRYSCGSTKSVK